MRLASSWHSGTGPKAVFKSTVLGLCKDVGTIKDDFCSCNPLPAWGASSLNAQQRIMEQPAEKKVQLSPRFMQRLNLYLLAVYTRHLLKPIFNYRTPLQALSDEGSAPRNRFQRCTLYLRTGLPARNGRRTEPLKRREAYSSRPQVLQLKC